MKLSDKIRDESYNMILTKEHQKISTLPLQKLINMNTLQVNKYYLLIEDK